MKRYFVFGDIHGFYTKFRQTLKKSGFDQNNPEHILLSLGDEFDRGTEAKKLLNFLLKMKKLNRLIMIKGNHTSLMWECLAEINTYGRVISDNHYSNGTVGTIAQLTNDDEITKALNLWYELTDSEIEKINKAMKKWQGLVRDNRMYLELGRYIFVHGWIPFDSADANMYHSRKTITYHEGWRDLPDFSPLWDSATWLGFPTAIKCNCFEPEKTIVCGHWHCSAYWGDIKRERKPFPEKNRKDWQKSFEPAITEEFIAIDACTAYSGLINILVFGEISEDNAVLLDNI